MSVVSGTLKQLSAGLTFNGQKLEVLELSVFLRVLERMGQARKVGSCPAATGKGKPSGVWEVDEGIQIVVELAK